MNRDATNRVLFVILLIFVLVSAYRVIAPFVTGFTWAAVLVAAFRPVHERLKSALGGRVGAATAAVTLLVAAFVVMPLLAAAAAAVQGGMTAIQWIETGHLDGWLDLGLGDRWPWTNDAIDRAKALFGLETLDLKSMAVSGFVKIDVSSPPRAPRSSAPRSA